MRPAAAVLLIIWSAGTFADPGGLGSMHDAVMSFVNRFPGSKAQCTAKAYSESLGLDAYESRDQVRRSNLGVIENNKEFLAKSPCFSTLVNDFYKDIPELEAGRATLADTAGQGRNKQFQSGWIWDKALKISQGDKSLAMALVNVCLNDDVAYSAKIQVRADHADQSTSAKRSEFLNSSIAQLKEMLGWKLSDLERGEYSQRLAKEEAELARLNSAKSDPGALVSAELNCPEPKSAAFLPGSLGKEADIPGDVKGPIADLLGTTKARMPAKYYHIYSAAAMGCALAKCGVTEAEAKLMQDTLARAYRGFRLCTVVKDARGLRASIEATSPGTLGDSGKREAMIARLSAAGSIRDFESALGPAFCKSEGGQSFCIKAPEVREPAQKAKYVRMMFDGLDAAQMFDAGKMIPGDSVPCTFAQYDGPKMGFDTDEPERGLFDKLLGRDACHQPSWSKERCTGALRTLRSWETDEMWSRLEHQRGVVFGLKQCQGQPVGQTEERACRILGPAAAPGTGGAEVTK